MFEGLKRIGKWEKKMLFAVLDGVCNAHVLLFMCMFAASSLWTEQIWVNVCFIVLAAAVSALGYWCICDDLTDKRKPFYCLLLSLVFACWVAWTIKDITYQNFSAFLLFGRFVPAAYEQLIMPDAAHELLVVFVACVYSVVAVVLRVGMCIFLEVRNRKMTQPILYENRFRKSRAAVLLPLLLVGTVCFTGALLYLSRLSIEVDSWTIFDFIPSRRSRNNGPEALVIVLLMPLIYALHPAWEDLNKYAELFDTYVRFNSFRFRWPQPAKSIQVKYEDIYVIDAKFIGKKLRYIELGCHNFKHKVRLSASIVGHKELFARLYNEVVKVNPDVFISEELKELLASYQQKP